MTRLQELRLVERAEQAYAAADAWAARARRHPRLAAACRRQRHRCESLAAELTDELAEWHGRKLPLFRPVPREDIHPRPVLLLGTTPPRGWWASRRWLWRMARFVEEGRRRGWCLVFLAGGDPNVGKTLIDRLRPDHDALWLPRTWPDDPIARDLRCRARKRGVPILYAPGAPLTPPRPLRLAEMEDAGHGVYLLDYDPFARPITADERAGEVLERS